MHKEELFLKPKIFSDILVELKKGNSKLFSSYLNEIYDKYICISKDFCPDEEFDLYIENKYPNDEDDYNWTEEENIFISEKYGKDEEKVRLTFRNFSFFRYLYNYILYYPNKKDSFSSNIEIKEEIYYGAELIYKELNSSVFEYNLNQILETCLYKWNDDLYGDGFRIRNKSIVLSSIIDQYMKKSYNRSLDLNPVYLIYFLAELEKKGELSE